MVNHLAIKNVSFPPRLHASGSRSQPSAVARRLRGLGKVKLILLLETRHPFPASPPEHLVLPNRLSPLCQAKHPKKKKKNPFLPHRSSQVASLAPERPRDRRTRSSRLQRPAGWLFDLQINLAKLLGWGLFPPPAFAGEKVRLVRYGQDGGTSSAGAEPWSGCGDRPWFIRGSCRSKPSRTAALPWERTPKPPSVTPAPSPARD